MLNHAAKFSNYITDFIVMSYYLDTVLYQFMLHDLIIKRG